MGIASGGQRPVLRMAPLRNCISRTSDVPGGVFPTNNSRLILSCADRVDEYPTTLEGGIRKPPVWESGGGAAAVGTIPADGMPPREGGDGEYLGERLLLLDLDRLRDRRL